jgi:hypothetical protein
MNTPPKISTDEGALYLWGMGKTSRPLFSSLINFYLSQQA